MKKKNKIANSLSVSGVLAFVASLLCFAITEFMPLIYITLISGIAMVSGLGYKVYLYEEEQNIKTTTDILGYPNYDSEENITKTVKNENILYPQRSKNNNTHINEVEKE